MPLIGWFLAQSISKYVEAIDHWIVFIIFVILGAKFIKDAFKEEKQEKLTCYLCFSYIMLVSIATSIDAMAAGASIYVTGTKILFPAVIIGVVPFFNSLFGFCGGQLFKKFPTKNLEISAGLILIILAFKVLFESLG